MRSRLTYPHVVSTLALFIALGGTSYAAAKLTGKDIKDASLTGRDVKDKSLTGKDVKDKSLKAADFGDPLPAGPRGAAGTNGAKGETGPTGPAGTPDGFTKTESDARFLPKTASQTVRVAALWTTASAGANNGGYTNGKTIFTRPTAGFVQVTLPLSIPVALNDVRVRPKSARVCFLQSSPGSTIVTTGVSIGSGNSAADDSEQATVAVADASGCLNIDIAAILGNRNIGPDTNLDLVIGAQTTGSSRFLQLGPADVKLVVDP
jgi:hypothetical protein